MKPLCKFFALTLFFAVSTAFADEIRPGFLEIKEIEANTFFILWKVPAKENRKLAITPHFPDTCRPLSDVHTAFPAGAAVQRWRLKCPQGLVDQSIAIDGLSGTNTDVLVRLAHADGRLQTVHLNPSNPAFRVAANPTTLMVARTYLVLGVEHILAGIDHLLFVFALLLIVVSLRQLLWTITAFTIAHSITLAGATLGWLSLPQQPVEAIIALSIVLLAVEVIRYQRGEIGITARWPWLVAFTFGLLHGFGFAGALEEIGLPQTAVPLALIFFNLGVECGQLLFVAAVLLGSALLRRFVSIPQQINATLLSYVFGSIASFWTFERVAGYWG